MTHLSIQQLEGMRACPDARKRFRKLFGQRAQVTRGNVDEFLGEGHLYTNYSWGAWLIRRLLEKTDANTKELFLRRAGAYAENFTEIPFDGRRAEALYQLLLAVEIPDAQD